MDRVGIRKAGNIGVVDTIVGNALLHTMPIAVSAGPRTAIITKIMAYNNTGVDVPLTFGTLDRNPAGAAFVALLPIVVAINTLDNEWLETEIPVVEWASNTTVTAAGRTGDIWVLSATADVEVQIEVKEFGS